MNLRLRVPTPFILAILLMLPLTAGAATLWGTEEQTGSIYAVDTVSHAVTLIDDTADVIPLPSEAEPNSNGFDITNQRFYFTTFTLVSALVAEPSQLYFNDFVNGGNHLAGTLATGCSSGTLHSGKFYYIAHGSDDLRQVTLRPDGSVLLDSKVVDITRNQKIWGFGDIAIANNGVLYGSATIRGPAPGGTVIGRELFSYRFSTGTYKELAKADCQHVDGILVCTGAWWGQVAFADDGQLWGHDSNTGDFFTIDLDTGAHSDVLFNLGMIFTDLAAVPPPAGSLDVTMDLWPRRYPNYVSLNNRGTIPVAILGSETFDVNEIDPTSLSLAGMPVKLKRNGQAICKARDISGDFITNGPKGTKDGYPDLYCRFQNLSDLWSPNIDGTVSVTGTLYDGTSIEAVDEVTYK